MTLARRVTGRGHVFLVDEDCLPQTIEVLATRAEPLGIELVVTAVTPDAIAAPAEGELFGVLLQYPGASGAVRDLTPLIEAATARGALTAVAADLLALTLLRSPGELGADIAVGSTQRFGLPMAFGGPHAGYIAVRDKLRRQLPGRIVGVSLDADGRPAYRLALQAREQHIRREKATSNICTAQVLPAVIAASTRCTTARTGWPTSPGTRTAARACSPPPWPTRAARSARTSSSTRSGSGCPEAGPPAALQRRGPGRAGGIQPVPGRRRRDPDLLRRDDHRDDPGRGGRGPAGPRAQPRAAGVAAGPPAAAGPAPRRRVPDPPGVPRSSQRDRRCCVTCGGCPTPTSPWTGR